MKNYSLKIGLYIKIIPVVIIPLLLYINELQVLFNEAINNNLTTHILSIPFLILYIVYSERRYIRTVISRGDKVADGYDRKTLLKDLAGFTLCLIAYMFKLYGSTTFLSLEYHVFSLPLFVSGLILIIFNQSVLRALYFPVVLLFFLVPPPFMIAQRAGSMLATFSAYASYNIVRVLTIPAELNTYYEAPIIYLTTRAGETVPFSIDIGCSGLYSLIGFVIFALFLMYISRGTPRNKVLVLLAGAPLIYLLNVLRVTLLLVVGYLAGVDVALNLFHLLGGWTLILLGTFLLLNFAEKTLNIRLFGSRSITCTHNGGGGEHCSSCGSILSCGRVSLTSYDMGRIMLIILMGAVLMIFRIPVFTLTASPNEVQVDQSSFMEEPMNLLPEIEGYDLRFVYRDTAFERISKQDASLMYSYRPLDPQKPLVWVGLEIAQTKASCHPWEACLITYAGRGKVTQVDLRDVQLLDNPPISARYFAFIEERTQNIQVVLYWYAKSIFKTAAGYEDKWVKLSVIAYAWEESQVVPSEIILLGFAKSIAEHWSPVSSWGALMISVAGNSGMILLFLIITLSTITASKVYLWHMSKLSARLLMEKINDPIDVALVNIVRKHPGLCDDDILGAYNKETAVQADAVQLLDKLYRAKSLNIIEDRIVKIDLEPYVRWYPIF